MSQKHGLQLLFVESRQNGFRDSGKIGDQRGGLAEGVILTEGNEKDILSHGECADVAKTHRKGIVGGGCDEKRPSVSQVRFCRHGYCGVDNAEREFGKRIARAGRDDETASAGRFARLPRCF